jgi:hypothetical protein
MALARVSYRKLFRLLPAASILGLTATVPVLAATRVLDSQIHHLGTANDPEWDVFAGATPEGTTFNLTFDGHQNRAEQTLFLFQDDVKLNWSVELNGRRLGNLFLMEAPLIHYLALPPGALREGANQLRLRPPSGRDDIRVGRFLLDDQPPDSVLGQCRLTVRVTDADQHVDLPCRLTITEENGTLAPLRVSPGDRLAGRPGVVYAAPGPAAIGLRPGRYIVYATRGFEYGLDSRTVTLEPSRTNHLDLSIRREVRTPGWIACDPHTHTFTYSRHGDATVEERALTLAGEGIELPVATDHNILTDYLWRSAKLSRVCSDKLSQRLEAEGAASSFQGVD